MKEIFEGHITNALMALKYRYREVFSPSTTNKERAWLWKDYKHLKTNRNWNRTNYEMSINNFNSPYVTGICYVVARFVKAYIKDVHNVDVSLMGLFEDNSRGECFCHAVIKHNSMYFDVFHDQGTGNWRDLLFADTCFMKEDFELGVNPLHSDHILVAKVLDTAKERLYPAGSSEVEYLKLTRLGE